MDCLTSLLFQDGLRPSIFLTVPKGKVPYIYDDGHICKPVNMKQHLQVECFLTFLLLSWLMTSFLTNRNWSDLLFALFLVEDSVSVSVLCVVLPSLLSVISCPSSYPLLLPARTLCPLHLLLSDSPAAAASWLFLIP